MIQNGILFSHKKNRSSVFCDNVDRNGKVKLNTERQDKNCTVKFAYGIKIVTVEVESRIVIT